MELLSYEQIPSFYRTREAIQAAKNSSQHIVAECLKRYSLVIFHAEVEINLRALFVNSPLLTHIDEKLFRSLTAKIVGELGYNDIKSKFKLNAWRQIERNVELKMKEILNDSTFHTNNLQYDEFIKARHQIAHTAETAYLIDENELEKCVLFMECFIETLKNHHLMSREGIYS